MSQGHSLRNFHITSTRSLNFLPVISPLIIKSEIKQHLFHSIPERVTNRGKYHKDLREKKILQEIEKYQDSDVKLNIIIKSGLKEKLAHIVIEAGIEATGDRDFRYELSHHVKNNFTSSKTGMPAFGYEIPTPISFIAPIMIKHINMNKVNRKKNTDLLVNHTPAFVVISAKKDNKQCWIKVGRIYERIALYCTKSGLATQPMAAPIQISKHFVELQKLLGIKYRPTFFFRLGRPLRECQHSPRLGVGEILEV